MIPPATSDWLFALIGWGITAGAAGLLLWALFWDRARGRRRCPRCWYDMAATPGLVCPECGGNARRERRLAKTRRRHRLAVLAALLAAIGIAAARGSDYWRRGWIALVPSSALVLIAQPEAPALTQFKWAGAWSPPPPSSPPNLNGAADESGSLLWTPPPQPQQVANVYAAAGIMAP